MVKTRELRDHETQRSSEPASLMTVERRIDFAEQLDGASVADTAAVLPGAERGVKVFESFDADHERLHRLVTHAAASAGRATGTDPDMGTFRGLM